MKTCLIIIVLGVFSSCRHSTEPHGALGVDTTTHSVVWRTDTIGYGSGSVIRDVAIISDDNIWAVGEVYLKDSTGLVDPALYNVLRWDGSSWNPLRLKYNYLGSDFVPAFFSILSFGPNDIWLSVSVPLHWDGHSLVVPNLGGFADGGYVYSMWGKASNDFFCVGSPGILGHFNGGSFETIPTGIRSELWSVTGQSDLVYVSSNAYDTGILPSGVFQYASGRLQFLFPDPSEPTEFRALGNAFSIWMSPQGTLWALGESYVFRPFVSHQAVRGINPKQAILRAIKGTADNDVWVAGSAGAVMHFNGSTWQTYNSSELGIAGVYTSYRTIAAKGNTVVIGGWTSEPEHAILTIGRRRL